MRGNLPQNEPKKYKQWDESKVYDKMKAYCEVAIFCRARDYLKYTFERRVNEQSVGSMIASIIINEDIRSAFMSMILLTAILALIPLCRFKSFPFSVNLTLVVYGFFALSSWLGYLSTESSACPEYDAYLSPLFAAFLGVVYLVAHISLDARFWKQKAAIALLCIWMFFVSDWSLIDELVQAYKQT